ncbi:aminotransferase-like domain-containing protein [Microscilla marina]|uniref:Aminotransferase, putative n=1 Tax=Microscilla marina ATCC 23134 TaxID=313606 RepID=A1ZGW6_MICM2|nr:PLP-dependent aminotransferase family protein [Microscilla marina]EAY30235.1 aminotransferase, putative [Microscilla marina ATCC 23134]
MTYQNSEYVQMPVTKGIYDLNVGQPSPQMLPLDLLYSTDRNHITDPTFLQYANQQGYLTFRKELAKFLSSETGDQIAANELLVTPGNSGAINLIGTRIAASSPTRPLALVETPTYQWAVNVLEGCGFDIMPIPVDKEGIDVVEVERLIIEEQVKPALVFVIPSHQNPTSVNLSAPRRQKLIQLAVTHDFYILADEAYQLLSFPENKVHSALASEDYTEKGVVFTIGTFSKIFAPAIRLGWLQAKPDLIEWMVNHPVLVSGGGVNQVMAGWIEPILSNGSMQKWLSDLRKELFQRYECLYKAVQQKLPLLEIVTTPQGGYFIWCKLPNQMDSSALAALALEKYKVSFRPGTKCNTSPDYLRLCFAYHTTDEIEKAVDLLALAYNEFADNLILK